MRALRLIWWEGAAVAGGPSIPPTGNITYPINTTVSGNILAIVSGADGDADYSHILFYINGSLAGSATWAGAASTTFPISTSNYSDGTYGAHAILYDTNAHLTTTTSVLFYIANSVTPAPPAFSGSFIAVPLTGNTPVSVEFTASISGSVAQIFWDFDGDGSFTASTTNATALFSTGGTFSPTMRLISGAGSVVDITNTNYLTFTSLSPSTADVIWRSWRSRL